MRSIRQRLRQLRSTLDEKRKSLTTPTSFVDEREDLALLFCTNVLKLESLHWGYWTGEQELTLGNLRRAQERFSHEMFSYIPGGVTSVLDVGCGMGDNARLLAERGYRVTAISPDANHQRHIEASGDVPFTFVRSGIEVFETTTRFDLVLMSESSHFFAMETGLAKCNELLGPAGHILSASMFRKANSREFPGFHIEDEWVRCAQEHGFVVRARRDITDQVLPSAELIQTVYQDYVPPLVEIAEKFLARAPWPKRWILTFLLGGQLAEVRHYLLSGFVSQIANPPLFRARARYVIHLLERAKD